MAIGIGGKGGKDGKGGAQQVGDLGVTSPGLVFSSLGLGKNSPGLVKGKRRMWNKEKLLFLLPFAYAYALLFFLIKKKFFFFILFFFFFVSSLFLLCAVWCVARCAKGCVQGCYGVVVKFLVFIAFGMCFGCVSCVCHTVPSGVPPVCAFRGLFRDTKKPRCLMRTNGAQGVSQRKIISRHRPILHRA